MMGYRTVEKVPIDLAALIQYRRVTDSHPASHSASHVAVASMHNAYLHRAVKML